jgi:hypothetical protein
MITQGSELGWSRSVGGVPGAKCVRTLANSGWLSGSALEANTE